MRPFTDLRVDVALGSERAVLPQALCTANEGALPLELFSHSEAHDAWFRAKVLRALEDTRPDVDDADADGTFESAARQLCARLRQVIDEARLGAICA